MWWGKRLNLSNKSTNKRTESARTGVALSSYTVQVLPSLGETDRNPSKTADDGKLQKIPRTLSVYILYRRRRVTSS